MSVHGRWRIVGSYHESEVEGASGGGCFELTLAIFDYGKDGSMRGYFGIDNGFEIVWLR